jgi:hypothetical protein
MFYALTEVDEIGLSMLQTGLYGETCMERKGLLGKRPGET